MNYYTVLRLSKNATKQEIRKAYLILAKRYHPDKTMNKKDSHEMQEKFSEIVKAYNVLLDDKKRSEYDKTLLSASYKQRVEQNPKNAQAKTAFRNGFSFYKKGDFWRAEKYFKSAVSLDSSAPLYKSYLGLTLARQGRSGELALNFCKQAIEKEMYNSHFHVNLGLVYRILGDTGNAIKSFEEAITWNEKDSRALEELEKIQGKRKGKGGFFSRFFSKGG